MDRVQTKVTENAGFDRFRGLIDRAINNTGNEYQAEETQISDPKKMEQCEEEGCHENASDRCALSFSEPLIELPLDKPAEKSLFGDGDKEEVVDEPDHGDHGDFRVPLHEIEMHRGPQHDQNADDAERDGDFHHLRKPFPGIDQWKSECEDEKPDERLVEIQPKVVRVRTRADAQLGSELPIVKAGKEMEGEGKGDSGYDAKKNISRAFLEIFF